MSKILIVDDNPLNIKVLCAALEGKSYRLLTATNGERALVSAERSKPDLILLDINMPGWDGYETCRRLKENPATAAIPVIFLSALDDVDSKVKAFQAGGVDYLTKPFNQEEVWVRVANHLKISALTADLEAQNQSLNQAMEEIRTFQDKLFETNQMLTDGMKYAQRLQNSVLPDKDEILRLFPNSFVLYLPKHIISGDLYYFHRRRHKTVFAAADCTGHGVPGAFVSMLVMNLLGRCVEDRGLTEPASVLEEMDFEIKRILKQHDGALHLQDGADMAFCCIDDRTMKLQFAGAMRPVYIVRNGELVKISGDRHSLGGSLVKHKGFNSKTFELRSGDAVYLCSDGFTDQFGGNANRKMNARIFKELLLSAQNVPFSEQKKYFSDFLNSWRGDNPQTDDILLLGLSVD